MRKVAKRVLIEGRVQGVFFRAYTQEAAIGFGITGWVRNLPDRRVEALFEGEKDRVLELIEFCKRGPPGARVKHIEVRWEEPTGEFKDFQIRY